MPVTGMSDPSQRPSQVAAGGAIKALFSLMDDCGMLVETMMQWIGTSPTKRVLNREIGDLSQDSLAGLPLLSYLRYNVMLTPDEVDALHPGLSAGRLQALGEMDNPDQMDLLLELGQTAGTRKILDAHFPDTFNLA
jgi:hypothetical protein